MGKRNGYLERRKIRDEVMQDAIRQTYQQYMTDMLILTLNDPEVMGKDVFGYVRLKRVLDAWGEEVRPVLRCTHQEPGSGLCPSQDGCGHEGHRR